MLHTKFKLEIGLIRIVVLFEIFAHSYSYLLYMQYKYKYIYEASKQFCNKPTFLHFYVL